MTFIPGAGADSGWSERATGSIGRDVVDQALFYQRDQDFLCGALMNRVLDEFSQRFLVFEDDRHRQVETGIHFLARRREGGSRADFDDAGDLFEAEGRFDETAAGFGVAGGSEPAEDDVGDWPLVCGGGERLARGEEQD